jgi:hypothetical protein
MVTSLPFLCLTALAQQEMSEVTVSRALIVTLALLLRDFLFKSFINILSTNLIRSVRNIYEILYIFIRSPITMGKNTNFQRKMQISLLIYYYITDLTIREILLYTRKECCGAASFLYGSGYKYWRVAVPLPAHIQQYSTECKVKTTSNTL